MLKALKYEFKNTYKFFLILLLGMIFANFMLYPLMTKIANQENPNIVIGLLIGVIALILLGCSIVFIFMIVSSFRKEFYTDQGYFTFSRPLSASTFLGSKLISSLIWTVLYTIAFGIINMVGLRVVIGNAEFAKMMSEILSSFRDMFSNSTIILNIINIIYSILGSIHGLLIMYLSIVISKVLFKKNTLGYIWFLFFIGFSYLTNIINIITYKNIPYYLTSEGIKYVPYDVVTGSGNLTTNLFINSNSALYNTIFSRNIGELIIFPIIIILIFSLTAYLINKKVEI